MASVVTLLGTANITAALHAYASRPRYFQWGKGSGQSAASTDLADTTGVTEARATGTSSQQTALFPNDTYRVVGAITAAGTRAITEVGVFDEAGSGSPPSGGNMALYADFSVINVESGDTITFTFNVQFI